MHKYLAATAALSLAILLPAPASASRPSRHPKAAVGQSAGLYSARARRRAKIILELQLLELRKAHLDRVRAVIEKRLPPDALFDDRPGVRPG